MQNDNAKQSRKLLMAVSLLMIILLADVTVHRCIDTDTLWGAATGRNILENGITYRHPFTIDNIYFVAQAWLFNVFTALFDTAGLPGIYIFALINTGLLFAVSYTYLSMYKGSRTLKTTICFFACLFFSRVYTIRLRPENITLVLLLIECIALEKYIRTERKAWLLLLPVTMILESNFHSSMVIFHLAVLLAYVFPSLNKKAYTDTGLLRKWKIILPVTAITVLSSLITPYGIDGIIYLFNSLAADPFSWLDMIEMEKTFLFSGTTAAILCIAALLAALYKTGTLRSFQLYLALGFTFCSVFTMRNIMFLYLVIIVLCAPLMEYPDNALKDISFDKKKTSLCIVTASVVSILLLTHMGILFYENRNDDMSIYITEREPEYTGLGEIDEYIRNDSGKPVKDIRLYTDINFGAAFEYLGYENIFIDARPEIYTEKVNRTKDIFNTYIILKKGYSPDNELEWNMKDILNEYQFDYIITEAIQSPYLQGYLDNPNETGYELAGTYGSDWNEFRLYKRVK